MSIRKYFSRGSVELKGLSAYLDGLDHRSRFAQVRRLNGRRQARLFEAAKGFRPVTLDDFVPKDVGTMQPVIHHGKNSLPIFSHFQKRFCRPEGRKGRHELWGYNEQLLKPVTGPGYFIVRPAEKGEVVIDYREVPPDRAQGWPRILPNSARLSRFVYYMTQDYMRGVSAHVSIGRATRYGKPLNNWFILCREA